MKLVVFGTGKIAEVVTSWIAEEGGLDVVGLTCDAAFVTAGESFGRPVVGFDDVERHYPPSSHNLLVAIGYQDLNRVRGERCAAARAKGYRLQTWISSRANLPRSCSIGDNCIVMPGASLQPHAELRNDVLVWDNAVVGHHAVVGDDCYLAANSTISSTTMLGPRSFVGVNAAVGQGLDVGADCFIGAGVVLTRNAAAGGVYVQPDTERHHIPSSRFSRIARLGG